MKAELETNELQNRGVSLTSETPSEAQMLIDLWNQKARPVEWARLPDGNIQLCIAPTPEENHQHRHQGEDRQPAGGTCQPEH